MKKGRFGIVLSFYAILAFVFAILRLPLLCVAVLAFVLLAEKDEWAGRQSIQAFGLSLLASIFGGFSGVGASWGALFSVFTVILSVVSALLYAAVVVFSILGILRVMKDQEANIPVLSDLAYKAYGQQKPRPQPFQGGVPPFQPPYVDPQQNGAPQQPFAGQPVPPQQPSAPTPPDNTTPGGQA